jgi:hypothetical protein
VTDENAILDEAVDNLKEAAQALRATQNRMWSAGMEDSTNYRNLSHRVSTALAMVEAAYVEARRRLGQNEGR